MKKILIIENDADTNDLLSDIFRASGYIVVQWIEYEAMHEIVELKPDLILIDYFLNGLLGSSICIVIKNNPLTKTIPVMLMSGIFDLEKIARDSCADDFLIKPFDIVELQRKLKRVQIN